MSKIAFSNNLAQLKSFATRGDGEAAVISAMLDNIKVLELSNDAEGDTAANTIRISAQLKDMDGSNIAAISNVLVTATAAGSPTLAAGTVGTQESGAWFKTDATGALEVDVTDVAAEAVLVSFQMDDGTVEMLELTFA